MVTPAHTVEEVRLAVDAAWQEVTHVTINGLMGSMPGRLDTCIAIRRSHINYFKNNCFE